MMMSKISIKRIYEPAKESDGYRILVDRLWPRGISKEKAKIDLWLKEVGPSNELRQWFGHDPAKFIEFKNRYIKELKSNPAIKELRSAIKAHPKVTLLYGAKDQTHNQAVVLSHFLAK